MLKMTSRSKAIMGAVFSVSGLMFLVDGKMLFAGIWLACSALHFFDVYRLWCKEKESV